LYGCDRRNNLVDIFIGEFFIIYWREKEKQSVIPVREKLFTWLKVGNISVTIVVAWDINLKQC